VTGKWISETEVNGLRPLRVLMFHQTIGEALSHSIKNKELENIILKKHIRELKVSLNSNP